VQNPLGRYYLYFAHHEGDRIRLAFADTLTGPWELYPQGVLQLEQSGFPTVPPREEDLDLRVKAWVSQGLDGLYPHIASPDALIDEQNQQIRLYYHGRNPDGTQRTRVSLSSDGLNFTALKPILGFPYFRTFCYRNYTYALAMPGVLYRSADGLTKFEPGTRLFNDDMRHSAVLVWGDTLYVFWTRVGDAPERILLSSIDLKRNWQQWQDSEPLEILKPERTWEGSDLPIVPSRRGSVMHPVNELHDPAVYVEGTAGEDMGEDMDVYLLYSCAGEQGLGIAKIEGLMESGQTPGQSSKQSPSR